MTLGLVVDVDDTLYLERDYVASGFRAVELWLSAAHGVVGVGARAWELFLAGRRGTTLGDALTECGADQSLLPGCVDVYRSHDPEITLLPDAGLFVAGLAGPAAVVTDGPVVSQRAKCRVLEVESWAEPVIVTAEHGLSKPDERVFQLAVADMAASRFAYIADNPAKDFIGPLHLGWAAVRVRRPGSLHFDAPTPAGVVEVPDLSAARDVLEGLHA